MRAERKKLFNNDTIWAMFYRDGKTLGEIADHFKVSIYDLSPWLTAPLRGTAQQEKGERG